MLSLVRVGAKRSSVSCVRVSVMRIFCINGVSSKMHAFSSHRIGDGLQIEYGRHSHTHTHSHISEQSVNGKVGQPAKHFGVHLFQGTRERQRRQEMTFVQMHCPLHSTSLCICIPMMLQTKSQKNPL